MERNKMKICCLQNENLQFAKFGFLAQLQEQYRKTIPSVAIQKLMQSLLWSCLKPPAGFAERDKKL